MLKLKLMETVFLHRAKSVGPWMPAQQSQSFLIITVSTTTFIPEISYKVCGVFESLGVFSVLYQIINQNFSHSLLWEHRNFVQLGGKIILYVTVWKRANWSLLHKWMKSYCRLLLIICITQLNKPTSSVQSVQLQRHLEVGEKKLHSFIIAQMPWTAHKIFTSRVLQGWWMCVAWWGVYEQL